MTAFTVKVQAERLLARLQGAGERLHQSLLRTIQRLAIDVQSTVKDGKLTGQVLHNRTGTLRRSINQKVDDQGTRIMASVGTNLRYAHIHEFGFDGVVNVREHVRRSRAQMNVPVKQRARKSDGEITVRAHQMHMRMPERSFLRSALNDKSTTIRDQIKQAARGALKS